jgi:tetratricopeptide (TPR) repeat protein
MNDWDDAERRVEKAQELFEQHRWSEALEELRAATSINPYNGSWFFNIGLTLDEMGRFDEAIEAYRQTLEIEPHDLQALNHLGIDLHRVGNLDEALKTFARIETIDPSFEPSYCHRIITYSEQGDHEKAEEMFYLARLYKEHCPHCYYNIGCSLYDRGLFEKAIYCWQKTLDLDDSHPAVQVRIAEAFWGKGEPEAARQHYLIGLRQDPGNTDILLDLGDLLMEMGRTEEAGEKFRRAIELAPEEPAGYFCHGQWLMRQLSPQRDEQAMLAFTKVLQLDPTYPGAHLRLGELHHRRRELQPARKHLRAELVLRPQEPQILLDLSNLLLDTGQTRAAVACLKRLVQVDPGNVDAWQNLAVAQFMVGRYDEGIASCQEALQRDPANAPSFYNLALAYEHLKRYDDAARWIQKGLDRWPNDLSLQKLELRVRVLKWKDRIVRMFQTLITAGRSPRPEGLYHLNKFRGG